MLIGSLSVDHAVAHQVTRPRVLFIHGYFATANVWTEWLPFFAARGFPAYAVNLRGRAGSMPDIDLGRASIQDFVDDAASVAAHFDAPPLVVGHSMGGLVAQCLAARGLARAAALITPAPPRGIPVLTPRVAIKQLKYLPAIVRSRLVVPDREDLRTLVLNRVPHDAQDAMLDQLVPDSGRAGRDMSLTGVPVDAARVRCPMLAVTADDDRFVPQHVVAKVARRYAAPLHTFKDHGHMIVNEPEWETLADLVARWFDGL